MTLLLLFLASSLQCVKEVYDPEWMVLAHETAQQHWCGFNWSFSCLAVLGTMFVDYGFSVLLHIYLLSIKVIQNAFKIEMELHLMSD